MPSQKIVNIIGFVNLTKKGGRDRERFFVKHAMTLVNKLSDHIAFYGFMTDDVKDEHYKFTFADKMFRRGDTFKRKDLLKEMMKASSLIKMNCFYYYGHFSGSFFGQLRSEVLDVMSLLPLLYMIQPKILFFDCCFGATIEMIHQLRKLRGILVASPGYAGGKGLIDTKTFLKGPSLNSKGTSRNLSYRNWAIDIVEEFKTYRSPKYICFLAIDMRIIRKATPYVSRMFNKGQFTFDRKYLLHVKDRFSYDLIPTIQHSESIKEKTKNKVIGILNDCIISHTKCTKSKGVSIQKEIPELYEKWYVGYEFYDKKQLLVDRKKKVVKK